jgi:hypothetical protein
MMSRLSLTNLCVAASLCFFRPAGGGAQTSAAPPVRPQSPSSPSADPASRMRSTGLEATGGSITAGVYTNSSFGFSLEIPPGWVVVPSDAPVIKPIKGQTPATGTRQTQRVLLVVTENAPLKRSDQRRSIQVIATKMAVQTGPSTAPEFLNYSRRMAKEQEMAVEYLGDPKEVTIHDRKLAEIDLTNNSSGGPQHVEHYVTVQNGVLLQFFLVSPDKAGLKDLQPYIQSLRLKPEVKPAAKSAKKKK